MFLPTRPQITILLYASAALALESDDNYISLRDEKFMGPDARLRILLAQRMAPEPALLAQLNAGAPRGSRLPPLPPLYSTANLTADGPPLPQSRRSPWDYHAEDEKVRVLALQEHLIVITRDRIQEMVGIVTRFKDDARFRIGYMLHKLGQWVESMRQWHDWTTRAMTDKRQIIHLTYYIYILRTYVDIVYTVEYLLYQHEHALLLLPRKEPEVNPIWDGDKPPEHELAAKQFLQDQAAGKDPTLPPKLSTVAPLYIP